MPVAPPEADFEHWTSRASVSPSIITSFMSPCLLWPRLLDAATTKWTRCASLTGRVVDPMHSLSVRHVS